MPRLPLTILILTFIMAFAILQVKSSEELLNEEDTTVMCQTFPSDSDAFKKCTVLKQAVEKLNNALDSIKDDKSDATDDKELQEQLFHVMTAKLEKLKSFLDKLDTNQGYPGLMQSFRFYGFRLSKLWALFVLLDPFEL